MHLSMYIPGFLFASHLDLLFGQHLSNIVACCIYGVARKLNVVLSFKRITETITALYPHHTVLVFQRAEVAAAFDDGDDEKLGDTRMLYNTIFLPAMQDFLLPDEMLSAEKTNSISQKPARLPLQSLSAQDASLRTIAKKRMNMMTQ